MEAAGTPSVMEKLMGLNGLPLQAPVQKQRRVMSENYLRRVASIGARESRHSFRLRVPEIMDYEGDHVAACIPMGSSLISEHQHNLQVSPSTCTSGSGNVDICRKSERRYELPNAILLQTFENGIVTESISFALLHHRIRLNLTVDLSTWCPLEWPVSLAVFETLEKKFGDQASWKRSDMRFLFDRINAGLMEIFEPCMGVPTWTKPVSRRIRSMPSEEMIEEDLWMLLVSQEKETRKDSIENALGREIELDLGDDIDGIDREIERFLFDKLIVEFVTVESF
ncbi:hypothetical protein ACFX15_001174 [Malus domestica]